MVQKLTGTAIGEARKQQFMAIVMREGEISRGVIIGRMRVTEQTFAREYKSYLEYYKSIKYNEHTRIFTFEP